MAKIEALDGKKPHSGTVDDEEIARFSAMAAEWWDPHGAFRPLHKFNPTRLAFIRDHVCRHFGRDAANHRPFEDLSLLDIGCGGGLVSEPMSRLGATVTGLDAAERNVRIAQAHAEQSDLPIRYLHSSAEDLAETDASFDVILNLEVVEHVADVSLFLATTVRLLRPGGIMVIATINRTPKAFALAILGAEYVLRWLPKGTHSFDKFVRPEEIVDALGESGAKVTGPFGVSYNPIADLWRQSKDTAVNYMMLAVKSAN